MPGRLLDCQVRSLRLCQARQVSRYGIPYTTVEYRDLDELPTEERLRIERELAQKGMAILLERLRCEQSS